jgi:hypothetical protein
VLLLSERHRLVPRLVHHSAEPMMRISRVLHSTHRPIRFDQRVLPLDHIPIPHLVLRLLIPCVGIFDSILKLVLGPILQKKQQSTPRYHSLGYSRSAPRSSAVAERTLALRIRPRDATPAPRIRPRDARQPTRTNWSKRDLPGLRRSAGCTRGRGAWCTPRWRRSPRSSPGPQLLPQRGWHRTQDTNEAFSGLLLVGFDGSTGGRRVARVFYS